MNSQLLLYPLILIGLLAALYFLLRRSKGKQLEPPPQQQASEPEMIKPKPIEEAPPTPVIPLPTAYPSAASAKIYFAFNGHDWEAHEALGVPVNAPLSTVTKMYQHLIKTSDTSTFDFYESAYTALVKKRKESK